MYIYIYIYSSIQLYTILYIHVHITYITYYIYIYIYIYNLKCRIFHPPTLPVPIKRYPISRRSSYVNSVPGKIRCHG